MTELFIAAILIVIAMLILTLTLRYRVCAKRVTTKSPEQQMGGTAPSTQLTDAPPPDQLQNTRRLVRQILDQQEHTEITERSSQSRAPE